ncbi:MAG: SGNH/GDSL hydrolase family protein [Sedimenticola sp.]
MTILVLGSSHICRLKAYVWANMGDFSFELSPPHKIVMHGISGAKIESDSHCKSFDRVVREHRPKGLVVQIGGNDLDQEGVDDDTAEAVVLRVICITSLLQRRYDIKKVMVAQFLTRQSTRHCRADAYNQAVHHANVFLKAQLLEDPALFYWKLKGVKNSVSNIWADGVHFSQVGQLKYYRNIRGAILQCLK